MEALDLIRRAEGSQDYVFKHALVMDALYNGLLSGPRATVHLKVAEELERRGANRLLEIAETLAHHYAATERADKAFTYLAMAGDKSLDVYSVPEAERYLRQALEVFDAHGACADRSSVARVMLRLLETLTNKGAYREVGVAASKFIPLIRENGETPELVYALYYQAMGLWAQLDIRAARDVALEELSIAQRLGDEKATVYARAELLFITTHLGANSLEVTNAIKADLLDSCVYLNDNYIINWTYYAIAWDYAYRGLLKEARQVARELIASGESRNDPRAIGQANMLLGYAEMVCDNFVAAIAHAEECVHVAVTENERRQGALIKATSRVLLGYAQEELAEIDAINSDLRDIGMTITIQRAPHAIASIMIGRITEGIRVLEREIALWDSVGDQCRSAWHRVILAEVFIQILSGKDKPPASVLLGNLWTISSVVVFGARRARRLLEQAAAVQEFSERGFMIARINFDLGVLSAMRKKRDEAKRYFESARVGAEGQGADMLLQKINAALAGLQRGQ